VLIEQVIEETHTLCMVSTWPTRNKNIYAVNLILNPRITYFSALVVFKRYALYKNPRFTYLLTS